MRYIKFLAGWIICSIVVFLPYGARIWVSETAGWIVTFIHKVYIKLMLYILRKAGSK